MSDYFLRVSCLCGYEYDLPVASGIPELDAFALARKQVNTSKCSKCHRAGDEARIRAVEFPRWRTGEVNATQPAEHPLWCEACWDLLRDLNYKERHGVTLTVLRDFFAGLALTKDQFISDDPAMWAHQAHRAYALADAMLAERERKPEGEAKA